MKKGKGGAGSGGNLCTAPLDALNPISIKQDTSPSLTGIGGEQELGHLHAGEIPYSTIRSFTPSN
jgi:hypothetical protein